MPLGGPVPRMYDPNSKNLTLPKGYSGSMDNGKMNAKSGGNMYKEPYKLRDDYYGKKKNRNEQPRQKSPQRPKERPPPKEAKAKPGKRYVPETYKRKVENRIIKRPDQVTKYVPTFETREIEAKTLQFGEPPRVPLFYEPTTMERETEQKTLIMPAAPANKAIFVPPSVPRKTEAKTPNLIRVPTPEQPMRRISTPDIFVAPVYAPVARSYRPPPRYSPLPDPIVQPPVYRYEPSPEPRRSYPMYPPMALVETRSHVPQTVHLPSRNEPVNWRSEAFDRGPPNYFRRHPRPIGMDSALRTSPMPSYNAVGSILRGTQVYGY